ncbi:SMP-30/gluconolactonase/LRE family protein [Bacteroidota bacterium]
MKNPILLLLFISLISCTGKSKQSDQSTEYSDEKMTQVKLEKAWMTDRVFLTPEAVLYDHEREVIYVANVNMNPWEKDGNGFISKIDLEGNIIELEWIKQLDGPKGMGISGNKLFVANIDEVVAIDIEAGKIIKRYPLERENPALNDITVGDDGTVYISGSSAEAVLKLKDGNVEVLVENDLGRPNGLYFIPGKLFMLGSNSHQLSVIDLATHEIKKLTENLGHGDGIVPDGKDGFFTSNWQGEIYHISPEWEANKLLDTKEEKINSADIDYIIEKNLLLVPTFFDNKVMAYRVRFE